MRNDDNRPLSEKRVSEMTDDEIRQLANAKPTFPMAVRTAPDGLYGKFRVARVDGRDRPGGDKACARYFVLDYVHDEYARAALRLYADLCEAQLPELAADLRRQLERPGPLSESEKRAIADIDQTCGVHVSDEALGTSPQAEQYRDVLGLDPAAGIRDADTTS